MRNWNPAGTSSTGQIPLFPAYLWGIETCYPDDQKPPLRRSQPTYEELKPLQAPPGTPRCPGSQPTYEELKRPRIRRAATAPAVPSLPMRNWNRSVLRAVQPAPRSQPTYEELKLLQAVEGANPLLRSQPTYEELKPTLVVLLYLVAVSSQPTYEELKRFISNSFDQYWKVPSLPMRNWNIRKKKLKKSWQKVPSLPMRNWNTAKLLKDYNLKIVPSLPMRNWNRKNFKNPTKNYLGSQPTYEELKPYKEAPEVLLLILFPAYLWGIETCIRSLCNLI